MLPDNKLRLGVFLRDEPAGAAVPAVAELWLELLPAVRATPERGARLGRLAAQKLLEQILGPLNLLVGDPY